MAAQPDPAPARDWQRGYLIALGVALAATLASLAWPDNPFRLYFGPLPRLVALALAAIMGGVALATLHRRGWIGRTARPLATVLPLSASLGAVLALPTLTVDLLAPWPETVNVAPPLGLAFYAAIAVVAETVFHLVPLALLLALAHRHAPRPALYWSAAALTALVEPVFQVLAGADPAAPAWRAPWMAVHLWVFALVQLALLRRFGLWGALGARLGYYLVWHILWGMARLPLLYPA
jgi:hypothetical protein